MMEQKHLSTIKAMKQQNWCWCKETDLAKQHHSTLKARNDA